MNKLEVTLVQAALVWHDAAANRRKFETLLARLAGHTDLVVLPEMFTTGFTMQPALVAEIDETRPRDANLSSAIRVFVLREARRGD